MCREWYKSAVARLKCANILSLEAVLIYNTVRQPVPVLQGPVTYTPMYTHVHTRTQTHTRTHTHTQR